ncbi:MAG: CpaF family protein, partial [Myxococcales bacterium]|nr:CpaF family protein [Myxococcales bacterium]
VAAAAPRPRLVGAGARRIAPRPIAAPLQRGVKLEPLDAKLVRMLDLQTQILERLRAKLDLDNIPIERLGDEDLWQKAERAIVDLVETLDTSGELPKYIDQNTLIKETLNEALGLGPLEDLLADDKVDEIVVDRRDRILVGTGGSLRGSGKAFSSDDVLERVVERLVAPTGHEISEAMPVVDVRLRDGSRLTAAVPPVAVRGAYLTLRKPRTAGQTLSDLVGAGGMSQAMADFLMTCIAARRNLLVCGGPGSGKSGVVAALAAASPDGERVVSVEEVNELALKRDEWVPLEARLPDGKLPAVELPQLVRAALRMHPDRLVVGDVRGGEAFDLAAALGSSIDGAIASVMGEGAQAALARLGAMAQLAAGDQAELAVRELVAGAFDVALHVVRYADGHSRVVAIEEVLGTREGGFDTQPIFAYRGGDDGYGATGAVPRFYGDLESRGIQADQSLFRA